MRAFVVRTTRASAPCTPASAPWVLAFIHLEVPVVVIGSAWILLGYVLCSERGGWHGSLHTRGEEPRSSVPASKG